MVARTPVRLEDVGVGVGERLAGVVCEIQRPIGDVGPEIIAERSGAVPVKGKSGESGDGYGPDVVEVVIRPPVTVRLVTLAHQVTVRR